jgi:hypothetical protein
VVSRTELATDYTDCIHGSIRVCNPCCLWLKTTGYRP